jgi:hypothetical protein
VKKIYLSGPMSGIPDHNRTAFLAVATDLRSKGYEVVSPPELDGTADDIGWEACLKRDLSEMLRCDSLVVLPGWRDSKGATLETEVAQRLGMPIYDAKTLQPIDDSPCTEAYQLVNGLRARYYGHPLDNFAKIASFWEVIFGHGVTIDDVAHCMMAVKIARNMNMPKRDNLTDTAGYSEALWLAWKEKERREADAGKSQQAAG